MPDHTLRAFADHGELARMLTADPDAAERTLADAQAAEIDLAIVTAELERERVQSFCVTAISCWTASRASSL